MRLPLTAWAWFITSCMGLTAFAVLMPACILLILDHVAGTSFFVASNLVINDQLQPHSGGSTLLWQHLFWFFGHPEVYIAIVPGMGIVSHVLIANMRKPMLSHRVLIYSMGALAVLSYMVYGHHMFVSGMNPFSSLAFSFPTLMITIPSTIIVLIWIGSLYGAKLRINSASLFSLGFVSMFVSGGVSGFFLAQPSIDIMLHATYFVVGHFHMVMGVAAMFGIFAGTYFWFPKMTGRMMNETLGKVHFWLSFVGAYCIFMPFHYLGMAGNVRRYSAFVVEYLQPLIPVHRFITVAAIAHRRCPTDFCLQPDSQPLLGQAGAGQSVGSDVAGVEHSHAAAFRQLRRKASRGLSRSLPIRGEEFDRRLPDADFARASSDRERREITG